MRYICVEEHYGSPGFFEGPGQAFKQQLLNSGLQGDVVVRNLSGVDAERVAQMDAAGIDMQLLSLNNPGVEQSEPDQAIAVARESNAFLAQQIAANPTRFAGLATVPLPAPEAAAEELKLRMGQPGFRGAIVNGHSKGRYLDDPFFAPFLQAAAALDAPIYLHPTLSPAPVLGAQFSGFTPQVNFLLAGPAWGWHLETGLHVIRMILGGVFDRFPKLQVVIGHMGEGLPFMLPRLDAFLTQAATKLDRRVSDYLRENVHYTFGGFNYPATFLNLLLEVGADRIMFSVDYPYGSMSEGREFLENLAISPADKAKIAHGNAERLFKL